MPIDSVWRTGLLAVPVRWPSRAEDRIVSGLEGVWVRSMLPSFSVSDATRSCNSSAGIRRSAESGGGRAES